MFREVQGILNNQYPLFLKDILNTTYQISYCFKYNDQKVRYFFKREQKPIRAKFLNFTGRFQELIRHGL